MATSPLFKQLHGFLEEIEQTRKTASAKKADAKSDPGSVGGESSHPSADQTGEKANLTDATEGARSAENEADVKKSIPANVNETTGNIGATQDSVQMGQGVKATMTGEDPAVEDNYKSDKDDPGTTAKARVDDGEKYGSYAGKPFGELYKSAGDLANGILAKIATSNVTPKAPAQQPATKQADKNIAPPAEDPRVKAAKAGYDLAAQAGVTQTPEQIKLANTKLAAAQVIQDAFRAADLTADYFASYYAQQKRAADDSDSESGEKEEPKKEESAESGGGGDGPPSGGDSGPPGGGDPGMGGMGGTGGDPMGGGGDPQQAIQQLIMALMEMGVTPDMLLQGAQGMGGPGGGVMPPPGGGGGDPMAAMGGGGGPPPGAGGLHPGMEVAAAAKQKLVKVAAQAKAVHQDMVRKGTFAYQPAKNAAEQQLRKQIQGCAREILSNR